METFCALLAICAGNSPVPGEFPTQRPVTRSFGVYFDLRPNKRLSKQSWGWWFETHSRPLWRHHNVNREKYRPFWSSTNVLNSVSVKPRDPIGQHYSNIKNKGKYLQQYWKLPESFEIHLVRQHLVNFARLAGLGNANVYKTETIFTSLGMANSPNFNTAMANVTFLLFLPWDLS